MNNKNIVNKTAAYVQEALRDAEPGHDWWHICRVWNNSKYICKIEGADFLIVELAALLHDIADYKFHEGNEDIGPQMAADWLSANHVPSRVINHVVEIIRNMNYRGPVTEEVALSIEHAVVQDADRLDAIGAIGIARAFSFGGYFGLEIHNPALQPDLKMSQTKYKARRSTVINHFYEKLLLVRNRMLTKTGKRLALDRHTFMEKFLEKFFGEWDLA